MVLGMTASSLITGDTTIGQLMFDLGVYRSTAERLVQGLPLSQFIRGGEAWWHYLPQGALFFTPTTWVSFITAALFWLVVLAGAYVAAVLILKNLYEKQFRFGPVLGAGMLAALLFNADATGTAVFGNIAPVLFLLAVLCIWAVHRANPTIIGMAVTIYLLTKWYWLIFPITLVLFTRNKTFILRCILHSVLITSLVTIVYLLVAGPEMGVQNFVDYVRFLGTGDATYPWAGTETMFNNLNHGVIQTTYRYLGIDHPLADIVRWIVPGAGGLFMLALSWQAWRKGVRFSTHPGVVLMLGFGWYLITLLALPYLPEVILSAAALPLLWNHKKEAPGQTKVRLWTIPLMIWVLNQLLTVPGTFGNMPFLVITSYVPTLLIVIPCLFVSIGLYVRRETEVVAAMPQGAGVFPMPAKRTFETQRHGAGK